MTHLNPQIDLRFAVPDMAVVHPNEEWVYRVSDRWFPEEMFTEDQLDYFAGILMNGCG